MLRTGHELNKRLSVVLCSGVDPNFIDGAVVQLVSLAEVLGLAGFDITVVLRGRIRDRDGRLSGDLLGLDGVTVIEPEKGEARNRSGLISPDELAAKVNRYAIEHRSDLVIARDLELNLALIKHPALTGRLCSYLTNIPENVSDLTPRLREQISSIASQSRIFFVQTEEGRSFLEAEFPEVAGRTALMLPMIPDSVLGQLYHEADTDQTGTLELVYSGKFKKEWMTLEMTGLPARAAECGVDVRVTFLGDKFMIARDDPSWMPRMQAALEQTDGVEWLGAMSREESLVQVARAHCGLSWRDISVDMSSQLSTKVLEYAAAGTPPLLRRTSTHESVFGKDYPLFIEGDDLLPTLLKIAVDRDLVLDARDQARNAVRPFTFSVRAAALKRSIERAFLPQRIFVGRKQRTKVLLAGHDFKFLGDLIDLWRRDDEIDLVFDKWAYPNAAKGSIDAESFRSADVIFCEWSANNAVWYSKHKLPHQKLVIRMHRFEMDGRWPPLIDYENVDAFVVVGAHLAERMKNETSVRHERLHHIPNSIDCLDLDRPKIEGAQFRLGLGGIVPIRKRPDRAIAVLRELKRFDERYTLSIRGRLPSSYTDFNRNGFFRLYYQDIFRTLTAGSDLHGSVVHERFGPDMANWFRRIGWILSPSTDESFHLAVAEGMASGTVPVLWDWLGAAETYLPEDVHVDDPRRIAAHIHETVLNGTWHERSEHGKKFVQQYDREAINERWQKLLNSLSPATTERRDSK